MSTVPVPDHAPRIGIVGAGRTQQGLGPYLAAAFAAAGCRVTAVAGRDANGALRGAKQLTATLGHPVDAAADTAALAGAVDALVIASPVPSHAAALDAALAAGVACLCEKPLVGWREAEAGRARIRTFAARGLLLDENCQWPFVLPALFELFPQLRTEPPREVRMRLSPVGRGPSMVEDSLSHVLSVVQALVPWASAALLAEIGQSDARADAEHNVVRFELRAGNRQVRVELHVQHCPQQPRPAWIEVDGCRMERRIGAGYTISFAGGGREVKTPDPLRQLVYRFAGLLTQRSRDRTTALANLVDARLRLYADLLRHVCDG
ncbi:MAG: Gfo/Idh/MocA family oxidoreductase [Planctomycetes bacterium]|nr:Gfo/Idh/MocA family oxidoreductase [Planctomycetota bacterium]